MERGWWANDKFQGTTRVGGKEVGRDNNSTGERLEKRKGKKEEQITGGIPESRDTNHKGGRYNLRGKESVV